MLTEMELRAALDAIAYGRASKKHEKMAAVVEAFAELRRELRMAEGWWTCDACGKEFPPEEEKSGHECDLCHECLSQQREENQCPK